MALHLKQLGIPLVIMSSNPAMTQFAVEKRLTVGGASPSGQPRLRAATEAAVPRRNNGGRQDVISTS